MIYEACFDPRRGSGNDVNCFFFLFVKIARDGTKMEQRWKVGDRIYLMAGFFFSLFLRMGVELYPPDECTESWIPFFGGLGIG